MLGVKKVYFLIAPIFGIFDKFLDEFMTVLLVLLLTPTSSLLSAQNVFKAKSNNLVVFNNKVNSAAILLKL